MELSLCKALGIDRRTNDPARYLLGSGRQHWTLSQISAEIDTASHYVFSCVRNPYDRAVSQVLWLAGRQDTLPLTAAPPDDRGAWDSNFELLCSAGDKLLLHDLSLEQVDYLGAAVDLTIRFEDLLAGWGAVCEHIGIPVNLGWGKNASPDRAVYREYYSDCSRELVRHRYSRDFSAYGYSF